MNDAAEQPDRIQPYYEMSTPGEEIRLIEKVDATIRQKVNDPDKTIEEEGTLNIIQEWSPMGLYWEITNINGQAFSFGEVEIISEPITTKCRIYSLGTNRVAGYIEGSIKIGSDHNLDKLIFHLHDYPDLYGGTLYDDELLIEEKTYHIRWSEVILEAEGWTVRLQPCKNFVELDKLTRGTQKIILSGVGEIRKTNGDQIKTKEIEPILEALNFFLSFSFADWSPPLLAVGSNAHTDNSCQYWTSYDISPRRFLKGWVAPLRGHYLSNAFPGFMKLWSNEKWLEPIQLLVHWLIETTRRSGGIDGAIAIAQIPLEMLAWLIFVDEKKIFKDGEFKSLSAATEIQLLLDHCDIPLDVPSELIALKKVISKISVNEIKNGPQLITKVRNSIIHPHEKNRSSIADWETKSGYKILDIHWETHQLFKWYITLIMLKLIGYSGMYADRMTPEKYGSFKEVPWASDSNKETK